MRNWFAIIVLSVIGFFMCVLCLALAAMFARAGQQWCAGGCFLALVCVMFSTATVVMDVYFYNENVDFFLK